MMEYSVKHEVKFKKTFDTFDHVLCFDLAQYDTGVALIETKTNKLVFIKQITVVNKETCAMANIYKQLQDTWTEINESLKINVDKLLILKEQCPLRHQFTTIRSLTSLARVHAIFDLWVAHNQLSVYSYMGIHATSIKASLGRLIGMKKPSKDDIHQYAIGNTIHNFDESEFTNDITDAIAVYCCLVENKWNSDLKEEMKLVKRKMNELKTKKAKERKQEELDHLKSLMI